VFDTARKRDPMWEGRVFEGYAWPMVRHNFPRYDGWVQFEQPTLPSGLRPDNVLMNEKTDDFVVVEMKDVVELTEAHLAQVITYMEEIGASRGFVPVAWDTEVPRRVRSLARKSGITIRRTWWRR
jgi:hypothetical protein